MDIEYTFTVVGSYLASAATWLQWLSAVYAAWVFTAGNKSAGQSAWRGARKAYAGFRAWLRKPSRTRLLEMQLAQLVAQLPASATTHSNKRCP